MYNLLFIKCRKINSRFLHGKLCKEDYKINKKEIRSLVNTKFPYKKSRNKKKSNKKANRKNEVYKKRSL